MKKIGILLGIIFIGIIIGIFWWQNGLLPVNSSNKNPKIFVIKNGEGVREIANNLKAENLIRDPIVFFLLTRQGGFDKQIQAGDFRLNQAMSTNEIVSTLTHGILDIWVTFPEGLRAEEIANILQQKIPSFNETWRKNLDQNEGYLFPDTYLIPKDASVDLILALFKNNFDKKFQEAQTERTNKLSQGQAVILASMIEREAANANDRPLVASVIINRLDLGMALQIDATVQYALGYSDSEKKWWKKNLTIDDLKINSPYNTYTNAGLPPAPISNPGLSSLKAALSPANTDYLYYLTDNKGITHFARTLEEHNANIKTYGL
jgi:UPF0755 protein